LFYHQVINGKEEGKKDLGEADERSMKVKCHPVMSEK